uniref:uncharacterized protein n=1 Tax=Pristiophorus japonicus TaxID=55135 RepID=UPI00398F2974
MVHTGERCCKEWNDLVRVARKKTSAIAADQRRTGGGSPTQEPLTENEIRALSLVRDSNYATTGIGADPPIQDDSEDSNQTSAERPDDRSTASTSAVTQPSPDFTPARDDEEKEEEEEEEPLILEPVEVEVGVETEKDITVPCGTAGTSSTTDSIFRGFPHASSYSVGPSGVQQGAPSVAVPLPQRWRLVQKRSIAARQIGAYQDMVHLSQASVDKGRELLKAMATIARNISAQSERQSEEMSRLITAME